MSILAAALGVLGFGVTVSPLPAPGQIIPNAAVHGSRALQSVPVKWTFMVYMNGDNNLEEFAIQDFLEIAEVGSSPEVRVVVQMDRIHSKESWDNSSYGDWSGTLRFDMRRGIRPTPSDAVPVAEGGFPADHEVDMGRPDALRDFVSWAQARYPAERYALVVWDHGAGWRVFANSPEVVSETRYSAIFDSLVTTPDTGLIQLDSLASLTLFSPVLNHPVRSVSHDETSGSQLYNSQIQITLESFPAEARLDLIGFDACLMAMVETGYAMRKVGEVMVASEELEPGPGWQYELILQRLVSSPDMSARELGRVIVETYKDTYNTGGFYTTLSAIDLRAMEALASSIDAFVKALEQAIVIPQQNEHIRTARAACRIYGRSHGFYNVDLVCFTEKVAASTTDLVLRISADEVTSQLRSAVIHNYADRWMAKADFGSHGLAIYFPPNRKCYTRDPLSSAYRQSNAIHPVEFVKNHRWDEWLLTYTRHVITPPPECVGPTNTPNRRE